MNKKVHVAGPWITDREISYVTDAVATAWFDNANTYINRFERAFEAWLGVKHAITLPSCTSALHLSLAALGIGPGDEVIVPECTWIASSAPITYVGATPVFADIDPITWCIDVQSVRRAITSCTKAVIAVDLYGSMPDMQPLTGLLKEKGIPLIEDAAEAVGSRYKGRLAGTFGLAGVFSFHGSKTLTTGEGGMLVTNDDTLFNRIQKLRDHGRKPGDRMFFNEEIGYKYKMSALQAALGLAQLERVDELVQRKREIFKWYSDRLRGANGIQLNDDSENLRNSFWMTTIIIPPELGHTTESVMAGLEREKIDARPFFHPLSSIPAYQSHPSAVGMREANPVAYRLSPYGINLPSGLQLTEGDVAHVCNKLMEILQIGPRA